MNYYFLAATLPMPDLDAPPAMGEAAFRALCAEHLAKADLRALDSLLAGAGGRHAHPFERRWLRGETQVRNAAARQRASRLKVDAGPYLRAHDGFDATIERQVADALAHGGPLDREKALDRIRWRLIEDACGTNPFGIEAILGYALKLRLAARWAGLREDRGRETAEALVNRAMEQR